MTASEDISPEVVWKTLREKLIDLGASEEETNAAAGQSLEQLAILVARHVSFPGARRYTPADVYRLAGAPEETARALWRAMGFPEVPDDERAFTDADVEAVRIATALFDRAGMDEAIVLQQARTMGQAAARLAAAHQDVIGEVIHVEDPLLAARESVSLAEEVLPTIDHLIAYMYRRHLAAAIEQRMLTQPTEEGGVTMSIGFADLSGFTERSQELDVRELSELVDRFNSATAGVVAQCAGRVIKTIGDEIMFTTLGASAAATLAIRLVEEVSGRNDLPELKVGLATGVVIPREGDIFGPPVNLASRVVTTAIPGSVLIDEATRAALEGVDGFRFSDVGPKRLKGIGVVHLHRLRRADDEQSDTRHGSRRRVRG
ncbi:MAG: adenylate/guanylate cyclase domain-containing protein [Actinomycetota bacterium]